MTAVSALSSAAKRLQGKVALITGGARGIGAATAKCFADHGAKVVIADVRDELGRSLCDESAANNGGTISYVHCDVTKEADIRDAVDETVSMHGKLDIIFNNAGVLGNTDPRVSAIDAAELRYVFEVNTFGAFYGAKHAARVMVPARRGSILFTSSVSSVTSGLVSHAYAASKHAIVGLTKNLCVELGRHGIRVNCISPYGVATPMLMDFVESSQQGGGDSSGMTNIENWLRTSANLKEALSEVEDIAEAALYLASDESKYVSGMNLVVDGGYHTTNVALGSNLHMLG